MPRENKDQHTSVLGLLRDEKLRLSIRKSKNMDSREAEELLVRIKLQYAERRHRRTLRRRWISAAAVAIVVLVGGAGLYLTRLNTPLPLASMASLLPGSPDVQLIVGTQRYLFARNTDFSISGNTIIARSAQQSKTIEMDPRLAMNRVYAPRGRKSNLVLADGTTVNLNSESSFTFPSSFPDSRRDVSLDGEAFFKVAKNAAKPFTVSTASFNVQVTGTQFNVNAYTADKVKTVVLAEGGVRITSKDLRRTVNMKPDELLTMQAGEWSISHVSAQDYTCWKDGYMLLQDMTLSEVLHHLSRHYGTSISCSSKIERLKCSGKLMLFDNEEGTVASLATIFNLKYTKKQGKIIIYM